VSRYRVFRRFNELGPQPPKKMENVRLTKFSEKGCKWWNYNLQHDRRPSRYWRCTEAPPPIKFLNQATQHNAMSLESGIVVQQTGHWTCNQVVADRLLVGTPTRSQTRNLPIANLTPNPVCHHATHSFKAQNEAKHTEQTQIEEYVKL